MEVPRWVGLALLRSPGLWVWAAFCSLVWPSLASFADHAVTTEEGTPLATLYEFAFISLQFGGLATLWLLDESRSLFTRTAPGRRLAAEGSGLLTGCLLFAAAGTLGPIAWTAAGPGFQDAALGLRLVGASAHLAAVAMVLLHLPLGSWTRRLLLPVLTWALPSLLGPEAILGPWICRVFGVAAQLLPEGFLTPSRVAYDSGPSYQAATLLGWLLLAWMTVPGQARDYALRDPR